MAEEQKQAPAPSGSGGGGQRREGGPGGGRREGGPGGGPGGPGGRPRGKRQYFRKKKVCKFCVEKIDFIDYKRADILSQFVQERGKILPRRMTGVCARHQRFAAVLGQRCGHAGASRSDSRRAWRAPAGRRGASRTDRYGASRAGARAGRRSAQGLSC
jgi:small subunit ribosomal protein S18